MKILGTELARSTPPTVADEHTLVALADDGSVSRVENVDGFSAIAPSLARLVGDDPFLLGVDVPVVVPPKAARARPIENVIRRRLGARLPAGGRAAAEKTGLPGETLMAGLATVGLPCLPYPDRNRRRSGLAETHTGLILKNLLWQSGPGVDAGDELVREELLRAYAAPAYRAEKLPGRSGWTDQVVALDLLLRSLGTVEGYDLDPVREALARAASEIDSERAARLLDAILIAGTARRYLEAPETCVFMGDQETGYLISPADGLVRRLASARPRSGELFPQASLRERLGRSVRLRSMDLVEVPGRPHRLEASFSEPPRYEFDNVDEMLWWKHCRHVTGPPLPVEGLGELIVSLGDDDESTLRLIRSRHRTLSFRFEPPAAWRSRVPTRDGATYPFRVLRAVYETLPADN